MVFGSCLGVAACLLTVGRRRKVWAGPSGFPSHFLAPPVSQPHFCFLDPDHACPLANDIVLAPFRQALLSDWAPSCFLFPRWVRPVSPQRPALASCDTVLAHSNLACSCSPRSLIFSREKNKQVLFRCSCASCPVCSTPSHPELIKSAAEIATTCRSVSPPRFFCWSAMTG